MVEKSKREMLPPPENTAPRKRRWRSAALVGVLVTSAVTWSGVEMVNRYRAAHPQTPIGAVLPPTSGSQTMFPKVVPSTPTEASPSTTTTAKAEVAAGPGEIPLGTPISYVMRTKAAGVQQVTLTKMSCSEPGVCEITPVQGRPDLAKREITPPEPADISDHTNPLWKNVYYFDEDNRFIMSHSTHYVDEYGSYFGGQIFKDITVGDSLDVTTTTGLHTYSAISTQIPSKDTSSGTYLWNDAKNALTQDELLFTTCNEDNNNFNVIVVFKETSAVPIATTTP